MPEIALSQGLVALIDDEDVPRSTSHAYPHPSRVHHASDDHASAVQSSE
jgi:hypothetical protein